MTACAFQALDGYPHLASPTQRSQDSQGPPDLTSHGIVLSSNSTSPERKSQGILFSSNSTSPERSSRPSIHVHAYAPAAVRKLDLGGANSGSGGRRNDSTAPVPALPACSGTCPADVADPSASDSLIQAPHGTAASQSAGARGIEGGAAAADVALPARELEKPSPVSGSAKKAGALRASLARFAQRFVPSAAARSPKSPAHKSNKSRGLPCSEPSSQVCCLRLSCPSCMPCAS